MGNQLGKTLLEYSDLIDDDERVKLNLKRQFSLRKRKALQKAIVINQDQP